MIHGLHHVALSVPDLETAVAFYADVLGYREISRESWSDSALADAVVGLHDSSASAAMLQLGSSFLELFEYHAPEPAPQAELPRACDHGLVHLCLEVVDIAAEYERMVAAGMWFHCPPQEVADGWTTYGRDPFGNIVELHEPVGEGSPTVRT